MYNWFPINSRQQEAIFLRWWPRKRQWSDCKKGRIHHIDRYKIWAKWNQTSERCTQFMSVVKLFFQMSNKNDHSHSFPFICKVLFYNSLLLKTSFTFTNCIYICVPSSPKFNTFTNLTRLHFFCFFGHVR